MLSCLLLPNLIDWSKKGNCGYFLCEKKHRFIHERQHFNDVHMNSNDVQMNYKFYRYFATLGFDFNFTGRIWGSLLTDIFIATIYLCLYVLCKCSILFVCLYDNFLYYGISFAVQFRNT